MMKKKPKTPRGVRATDDLMKELIQVPKDEVAKPKRKKRRKPRKE